VRANRARNAQKYEIYNNSYSLRVRGRARLLLRAVKHGRLRSGQTPSLAAPMTIPCTTRNDDRRRTHSTAPVTALRGHLERGRRLLRVFRVRLRSPNVENRVVVASTTAASNHHHHRSRRQPLVTATTTTATRRVPLLLLLLLLL